MALDLIKRRKCQTCGGTRYVKLVRNIAANGTSQVYWLCETHNGAAGQFIAHDMVKSAGINIDDLPVVENYSGREPCAVCGSMETELHHWLPRHLSPDKADEYPKSYLCHYHHMLWHELVTPDMNRREK